MLTKDDAVLVDQLIDEYMALIEIANRINPTALAEKFEITRHAIYHRIAEKKRRRETKETAA